MSELSEAFDIIMQLLFWGFLIYLIFLRPFIGDSVEGWLDRWFGSYNSNFDPSILPEPQIIDMEALQKKYEATNSECEAAKKYILSGTNFEQLCNFFGKEYKEVYGVDWKEKIQLPRTHSDMTDRERRWITLRTERFLDQDDILGLTYDFLLAKNGKLPPTILSGGFYVSDMDPESEEVLAVKAIEHVFHRYGYKEINFISKKALCFDRDPSTHLIPDIAVEYGKYWHRLW